LLHIAFNYCTIADALAFGKCNGQRLSHHWPQIL
jgi:hypothetical protein